MKNILSSALAASFTLYAAACATHPEAKDVGDLSIALTSVPSDVACVKVKVEGSRTVTQSFDVVAGAASNLSVARLPAGIVGVSAQAFGKACAVVGSNDEPAYATESPVPVRIDPAAVAQVTLKLLRNGRLAIGIDFETDEASCGTCDDKNPCTTDSCVAGACTFATVADGTLCQAGNLRVKILGFNDFHGQISAGRLVASRPVGGAVVLASYLKAAAAGLEDQTFIVHAGDHVGATPPASALLQDEPSIAFLNTLANASCTFADKANPACNMVGTLGNHEFDEGSSELLRLLDGGNFATGPFLEDPWQGARFPYVSANVVNEVTGQPLLRPYVIKTVRGVKVAFVGAVLKATPTVVTPTGVAGLKFLDEAVAANSYVPELKAAGVKAMVLLIHQGSPQTTVIGGVARTSYNGPTLTTGTTLNGAEILDIIKRLDSEFDVVVSGHAHSFSNALVANNQGKEILVTQAFANSTAFADIDLTLNPVTGDVVTKTASVVTTFADAGPGLVPQPAVAALVAAAEAKVAPLVNEVVGSATAALTRSANAAGEQALGNVIADAQRANTGTQFAFMNPGGVRADLDAGPITWGELFTIQPFGNSLVTMQMTGAQIKALLNQQLFGPAPATVRILSVSGLSYSWDQAQPVGSKVMEVKDAATGLPLDPAALYTVTTNNFLAAGGDGFTTFRLGLNQVGGDIDLDALVDWVKAHNPLVGAIDGRITRLN